MEDNDYSGALKYTQGIMEQLYSETPQLRESNRCWITSRYKSKFPEDSQSHRIDTGGEGSWE